MTSPGQSALALESGKRIEREGDSSLEHSWAYLQGVLDEALAAVQCARVRNAQMNTSLDSFRNRVSELEDHCASLQLRLEESASHAESVEDTLAQLRGEHDDLVTRNAEIAVTAEAYMELAKHVRRVEGRLRKVMEAVEQLNRSTSDIENHYGNDVDALAARAEEINFARDEAIQRVRRAVHGLRGRLGAKSENPTPTERSPEPERTTPSVASPSQYR
jgi:chromosome segregation ATPase